MLLYSILKILSYYFIDLLREYYKKYIIINIVLFYVFFLFIISETLLFVSLFWTSFHSLSSQTLSSRESFYLPHPSQLTFTNTLLLSNAGISLGNTFISLEINTSFLITFSLLSFLLTLIFISLQIKEFRILALSINDSLYGSIFFLLTGLHFFHLIIGLLLLSLLFWSYNYLLKYKKLKHYIAPNRRLEEDKDQL